MPVIDKNTVEVLLACSIRNDALINSKLMLRNHPIGRAKNILNQRFGYSSLLHSFAGVY